MGAAVAVLLSAPAALAADDVLTPERRALLDPANHPAATLRQQDAWQATASREGDVPGLLGNRHTLSLTLNRSSGFPADEDIAAPRVSVYLESYHCDAGGCTPRLRVNGAVLRPPGLVTTPDGPASAELVVTAATPGLRVENFSHTPVGPWSVDLSIVPSGPPFGGGAVTFASAETITYERGADGGSYVARNPQLTRPATASGSAFGFEFGAGDTATARRSEQLAEQLTPAAPVRTAAERRPYVPAVARGAIVDGRIDAYAVGSLARQPATSTGRVFPGNRTALDVFLGAESGESGLYATARSYRCATPGTPYEECEPLDGVRLTARATSAALVAGTDGRVAATQTFGVAPEESADPDPDAWGTIRLAVVAAPGPAGDVRTSLGYRRSGTTVEGSTSLTYGAAAGDTSRAPVIAVTLGTVLLLPPSRDGERTAVQYSRVFSGPVPAPT
jgi:hypothetical protein